MRFGGGPVLLPVFVLAFVLWLLFAIEGDQPVLLIIPAVALVLWLFGAFAFVRVDEAGIHRRCYFSHDDSWTDIRSIELRTVSFGANSARRMIRVHREHNRHWLTPASGNTRYNEDFARRLIAVARARGIQVTQPGWGGFQE